MNEKNMCSICAWREDCKKKFSVSGKDIRCPEFVKDISVNSEGKAPEADNAREN